MRFDIHHHHTHDLASVNARIDTVVLLINGLSKGVRNMSEQLAAVSSALSAMEAKVAETNKTLGDLAALVVNLQSVQPGNLQAEISALVARAQKVTDALAAAEDAADDVLPAPEPAPEPTPEPAPVEPPPVP